MFMYVFRRMLPDDAVVTAKIIVQITSSYIFVHLSSQTLELKNKINKCIISLQLKFRPLNVRILQILKCVYSG